jgi:hypothetical protein
MYVVKFKGRVVLGLIPWNAQYIQDVMRNRYRIVIELPYLEPESTEFPYIVNEDITIYPASENRDDNINPMIQQYFGPTWEFLEDHVVAHYEILPLKLEDAKNNYIARAANIRYNKEISGTKIIFNNIEYNIETNRNSRSKYIEKFIMLGDGESINWKFSEQWITLTKINIQNIIQAIDEHVQSAFDWEFNINNIINSATSLDDLLNIEELNSMDKPQEI